MSQSRPVLQVKKSRNNRMGGTYVFVVLTTLIIFTVSLAGLTSVRVMRRNIQQRDDAREALWLAYSGMEHAVATIANSEDWRTYLPHAENTQWHRLGSGAFRWRLIDEDEDLSDNLNDPIGVIAIGSAGDSIRTLYQELQPTGVGMDILQSAVHCSGNLSIESTKIWEGRFSSNGTLTVPQGNVVSGNHQGVVVAGGQLNIGGVIAHGTAMVLTSPLEMPSTEVFDHYWTRANVIDLKDIQSNGGWNGKLLSRTSNPWGEVNSEGIYYVKVTEGEVLEIENCRIKATLLIDLEEQSHLRVLRNVIWEAPAGRYPSMISRALSINSVAIEISGTGTLSEPVLGVNFNPPGLPFRGIQNSSQTDWLPATLRGLFHIIRQPGDQVSTLIRGDLPHKTCFIIEGHAIVQATCFASDSSLLQDAPPGYVVQPTMRPRPGSLRWIASDP